jgi:hypothetical protein
VIVVFLTPVSTVERVYWAHDWVYIKQPKLPPLAHSLHSSGAHDFTTSKLTPLWFLSLLSSQSSHLHPSRWYAMSWLFTLQLLLFSDILWVAQFLIHISMQAYASPRSTFNTSVEL